MPAACRRALSQSGEGPIVTSWKTRAVKRGQRSSSSIATVIQSVVRRSPSAGGSLSSSGVRSTPKSACTSRATPRIESRSARFEVTSSSITSWKQRHARGQRLARLPAVAEHHDPVVLAPRCRARAPTGSCRRRSRRAASSARCVRPSSSTVPGSATATVSPAPKFQAPHTIWRGSRSPTSTRVSCRRSAFGCLPASTTSPATISSSTPSTAGRPRRSTPSTLSPASESRAVSSSSGGSSARWSASHCSGHLHRTAPRNCSRKRTSLS